MNKFFRKAVSFVLAIAVISSIGCVAFANAEMQHMVFAGYDTTDVANPNRVYNEVINGVYTGKVILDPVEPEWRPGGYEGVYPYAGYSQMYLDGVQQPITAYNNLFPQWEERRQDYMWELKSPYYVYERQQTKVNNTTWTWDFGNKAFGIDDADLLTKTARPAWVVDQGYKYYGFGPYDANAKLVNDEILYMYQNFTLPTGFGTSRTVYDAAIAQWNHITGADVGYLPNNADAWNALGYYPLLSVNSLSATDPATGKYIVTDKMIADAIPVVYTKYVTAQYNQGSTEGLMTKVVADEYIKAHFDEKDEDLFINNTWNWDYQDGFAVRGDAYIGWTAPQYEMVGGAYRYFQTLIINNVVMDGTNDKPQIVRYTSGAGLPNVEWKFEFYQYRDGYDPILDGRKEGPYVYDAVERKYVNGVAAVDRDGNPIYRLALDSVNLANENLYTKVVNNAIEIWSVDAEGNNTVLAKHENYVGSIGGLINAYTNGTYKLLDVVGSEFGKSMN